MKLFNHFSAEAPVLGRNRDYVRRKTGWSDTILDAIGNMGEAEIYMKANLKERTVNGRQALTNPKVKGNQKNCRNTWYGRLHPEYRDWSNSDLMGEGCPPHDKRGDCIELHHIGQKQDSPYAELTWGQHMGNGNNRVLHKLGKESEIDRRKFDKERSEYWMARYASDRKSGDR